MKKLILLITCIFFFANTSIFADPSGLSNKSEFPNGLEKQEKIPHGWHEGEKQGWNRVHHHHVNHHMTNQKMHMDKENMNPEEPAFHSLNPSY